MWHWHHPDLMTQEMSSEQTAKEDWYAGGGGGGGGGNQQSPHGRHRVGTLGKAAGATHGEQKAQTWVWKSLLYFCGEPVVALHTHELRVTAQLAKQRCHLRNTPQTLPWTLPQGPVHRVSTTHTTWGWHLQSPEPQNW